MRGWLGGPAAAGTASGLLLGAATLPWDVGLLALVALVPLLAAVARGLSLRDGACAGFLCAMGFFGIGFAWGPFVSGGTWRCWVLYLAYVPIVALSGVAFGVALATLRRVGPGLALAGAPALWLALEEGQRAFLDSGSAWLRIGYVLAPWPSTIQLAAVGGVGLVSAWAVAVSAACVGALAPRRRALLAAALAAPVLAGAWQLRGPASADSVRVVAVQPAIADDQKFAPGRFDANLRRLLDLGDAPLREGASLVVWPESAYELPLGAHGFDPFLGTLVRDLGVPLVTGARRVVASSPEAPGLRNAALVLDASGSLRGVIDKVRPVPFFEAAPRAWSSRALARFGLWPGRFEPGVPSSVVRLGEGGALPIGVVVCFDITHPDLVRALRLQGARLLVNPSNEAFSGDWTAVAQARIARLRAVENGVPLVRAANTGPTEWIDAHGVLVRALAPGEATSGSSDVVLGGAPTPFTRFGDAPAGAALALPLLAALARRSRVPRSAAPRRALGAASVSSTFNR